MGYMGYEEKAYEDIDFRNKRRPALNQTNLNAMSDAINELDDRVLDLDRGIEWVFDGAICVLSYLPATNQLLYQRGNGSDIHYIDLPNPVIHGQIDNGVVSDSLVRYDITADDTVFAVFNKLPQISFAMINSNAQGNNYAYSLPNANSKGCTLLYKYYNNRGWLEFHSYDDPGNVYHAKVLDGQMSGWKKILSNKDVVTTEEQLNDNTAENSVIGAALAKDMFSNVVKKAYIQNIHLGPRWGRIIETEYCELIGNVLHVKFKIDMLHLQGTQWMATIHHAVQRPGATIGEAVAYVPATEAYYPLAVFPADIEGFLTIGYLYGMPTYTPPGGTYFADAIITAKIAVSPA